MFSVKKKMTDLLISLLRISVAVYAGLCILLLIIQPKYVYYPVKDVLSSPRDRGMKFENISLKAADGVRIAAWHVPAPVGSSDALTVLFCHGNAGNIGDRVSSVKTFHDMGMNVMLFDYRGYGDSEGNPSEKGTYADALAAWEYLVKEKGVSEKEIVVFGRSLGGAVAIWVASEKDPAALVVESTFTSAPDMAALMFPYLPVRLLCRFKYDSLDRIDDVKCPVAVTHGQDDMSVPYQHGKRLFEAAGEPKVFIDLVGGHNDGGLDICDSAQKALSVFLDTYCKAGRAADN